MTDERPLYYESDPKIQEVVGLTGLELRSRAITGLLTLDAAGGDNNERLSALAHWTAGLVQLALPLLRERIHAIWNEKEQRLELADRANAERHAYRLFLTDVLVRAIHLESDRASEQEETRQ